MRETVRVILCVIFLAQILGLVGCTPSVSQTGGVGKGTLATSREQGCEIAISNYQNPRPPGPVIGSITVGDTGFSTGCSAEQVNQIIKERACEAGAEMVYITKWSPPDFWSTCYRASADLMLLRDPNWPRIDSDRETIIADEVCQLIEGHIFLFHRKKSNCR
jgi:hypothetical protein